MTSMTTMNKNDTVDKRSFNDNDTDKKRIGLIAQDIQSVYPECINVGKESEDCPDGVLGICYTELVPVALQAIKELKAENQSLRSAIKNLTEFLKVKFPGEIPEV